MSDRMSRRKFISYAGAGAAGLAVVPSILAACGGDSDETNPAYKSAEGTRLDPIRQANGWINNVEFGGLWVAVENGYFTEQGVNPTFLQGGPTAPSPPVAVSAGDGQIGQDPSMLRVFQAMAEGGDDFVLFGTQFQTSPAGVISLPDRPVLEAKDLQGIKFLGQPGAENLVRAALKIGGYDEDNYEFIPAGWTPEPLMERQGEAYSCFLTNQALQLAAQGYVEGEDYVTATWDDLGVALYCNISFAPRSYVEENHDLLVRFMRGMVKGWEVNEQDPTYAAGLSVNKYGADLGLDLGQQIEENKMQIGMMKNDLTDRKGLFWMDPDVVADRMYPTMEAIGVNPLPDINKLLDLSILEDAYSGRTSMI
jgi:ABC-type nitrate/sulfonate/bicarbonate transport system substrate-binding protein